MSSWPGTFCALPDQKCGMRIAFLILSLSSLVSLLRADTPTEMKAALAVLKGDSAVKARIDYEYWRGSGDEKKPESEGASVNAKVEASSDGVRIFWDREQIRAAKEEQNKQGEEKKSAIQHAMSALSATHVSDYLDASPSLLRTLEHADLLSETTENWQGSPARLLTYKVNPQLSEKDRKYIKKLEATAKIWVGADGTPLAAERMVNVRGRALLVISFESHEKEEFRFARNGNRLVVISHQREQSGSGGGENNQEKTTAKLTLGEG